MPTSPSPYLTPPPTLPPTRGGSAAPVGRNSVFPHSQLTHSLSVPQYQHPTSVRIGLPPLPSVSTVRREEHDEEEDDSNPPRADKKRRVNKGGKAVDVLPSPQKDGAGAYARAQGESSRSPIENHLAPLGPPPARSGRGANLPSIKPIGFAASREARREDGGNLPSPVVMGFDFKAIDEDQLKTVGLTPFTTPAVPSALTTPHPQLNKTQAQFKLFHEQVRDTISIREQQQALIAARRREAAQSQPSTPKELTFKGWTPKDSAESDRSSVAPPAIPQAHPVSGGGVGRRREKTRDKVEKMSIVTSVSDREVVPGSKSAPLNQGLALQQESPREPPSGSQTAVPPHMLPPLHGYGHHTNGGGMSDPRTAPLSHARTRNGEEHEFARQQGPYYGMPQSRPAGRSYEAQQGNLRTVPAPGPGPSTSDRRNFSIPSGNLHPPPTSARYEVTSPRRLSGGGPHSNSPASPRVSREAFLAPFNQLYDLYAQTDGLRYSLQDLLNRYESAYLSQYKAIAEFKSTAGAAGTLLSNLQQSADSLKEMVRYEVERSNGAKDRELDEMRERLRRLEEKADKQG